MHIKTKTDQTSSTPDSFLPFRSIRILARNNLDFLCGDHFIVLHLERRVLDNECPDVVA